MRLSSAAIATPSRRRVTLAAGRTGPATLLVLALAAALLVTAQPASAQDQVSSSQSSDETRLVNATEEPDSSTPATPQAGAGTEGQPEGNSVSQGLADREAVPGPSLHGVMPKNGWGPMDPAAQQAEDEFYAPRLGKIDCDLEYLFWWTKAADVPPLVTTSPLGTPRPAAGVLGLDTTSVLFGDDSLLDRVRSGGRLTVAYWPRSLDAAGIEASYFGLEQGTTRFHATGQEYPILARPFFNAVTLAQDSHLADFPNLVSGSIDVHAATDLQGATLLLRRTVVQDCDFRFDTTVGYRFARLDDGLAIDEFLIPLTGVVPGTTIRVSDNFNTTNAFHGGELGLHFQSQQGRWSLRTLAKLGLGNTRSRVRIAGAKTTTVPPSNSVTTDGGLLAMPTNRGNFQDDHFSVIPEVGVTLGYDLTCNWRATFGYSFLYWSQVARAGDEIDTTVNTSQFDGGQLVGPARPAFAMVTNGFWAQGLNFGLECHF
ncbi:MAG: BBP7 family outer membrane beta-barrel protein [Pirellulales bacterium]